MATALLAEEIIRQLQAEVERLGWEDGDTITVKIGGTCVSGIDVGENYNKKWQTPLGTRKYNKDAFIVIENADRNPVTPSEPNPDLIAHHSKDDGINTTIT